jgi:hypothetical protein
MTGVLVLALLLTATPSDVSPDGQFRFTITERKADTLVLVRAVGPKNPIVGRITLHTSNVEARFVADDNLLVTWGCGTDCERAHLFTRQGAALAGLWFPEVSADGLYALDRDVLDLKTGDMAVSVVDLRSGKRSPGKPVVYAGLYLCTAAAVSTTEVVYSGCGTHRSRHVPFAH